MPSPSPDSVVDASRGRPVEGVEVKATHTPGPWLMMGRTVYALRGGTNRFDAYVQGYDVQVGEIEANARLIAAAPDLLEALRNVQQLISEAAMTGFNYKTGDWPERLFASQQKTSAALARATGTTS